MAIIFVVIAVALFFLSYSRRKKASRVQSALGLLFGFLFILGAASILWPRLSNPIDSIGAIIILVGYVFYRFKYREEITKQKTEVKQHKIDLSNEKAEKTKERRQYRRELRKRSMRLDYFGGFPTLTAIGLCTVIRSEDNSSISIALRGQNAHLMTPLIRGIQLVPHNKLVTSGSSGLLGAAVGDALFGSAGAIIGGIATRRKKTRSVGDSWITVAYEENGAVHQILFKGPGNSDGQRYYAKASSVFRGA